MLWPAACSLLAMAALVLFSLVREGTGYWPDLWGTITWIIVVVPLIVLACSLVLGGCAVLVALTVRAGLRVVDPDMPLALRRLVLAAATGTTTSIVVVSVVSALTAVAEGAPVELLMYSAVIGSVAALASSLYARDLFTGIERPPN